MSAQAPVHAVAAVTWRAGAHSELVPVEIIGPVADEIHVDIEAVGICHADIAAASGDFPVAFPIVLGNEGVGLIRSIGTEAKRMKSRGCVPGIWTPASGAHRAKNGPVRLVVRATRALRSGHEASLIPAALVPCELRGIA